MRPGRRITPEQRARARALIERVDAKLRAEDDAHLAHRRELHRERKAAPAWPKRETPTPWPDTEA